jgi:hypothetical protein
VLGSSSVPPLMIMRPGWIVGSSAIDDPHSGQKCRNIALPLSAGLVNVFNTPHSWVFRSRKQKRCPCAFGSPGNGRLQQIPAQHLRCNAQRRTGSRLGYSPLGLFKCAIARLRDCGRCDWGCDETNTGRLQQLTTFHDHLAMQATVPDAVTRKNRFRNARPPWAFPRRL